jgi:hypothetical protein
MEMLIRIRRRIFFIGVDFASIYKIKALFAKDYPEFCSLVA